MTFDEGKEFADSLGIKFIEASAKINSNVEKAFMTLAGDIKAKVGNDETAKGPSTKKAASLN